MKITKMLRLGLPLAAICVLAVCVTGAGLHRTGSQIEGLERLNLPNYTDTAGDSAGVGMFNYKRKLVAAQIETLRVPTTGNYIIVTDIFVWWKIVGANYDTFQVAVHQGVSATDSVFDWGGIADDYAKAVPLHFQPTQRWVCKASSVLVVTSSNGVATTADTLMVRVMGYETTGD